MRGHKKNAVNAVIILCLFFVCCTGEKQKTDQAVSDVRIKSQIVTTYTLNEVLNPFRMDVSVQNGIVNITGTVDSEAEKDLAVEIVRGIDGVKEINENISVEKAADKKTGEFFHYVNDVTITAKVKTKLLSNANVSGLSIDVTTNEGIVSLEGKTQKQAQKQLAEQLAKSVDGVKKVNNNLLVDGG